MRGEWKARLVGTVVVGIGGWQAGQAVGDFLPWGIVLLFVGVAMGLGLTPYVVTRPLSTLWIILSEVPVLTLVAGTMGLVLGLIVAALLSVPLSRIPGLAGVWVPMALSLVLGFLGIVVVVGRQVEFSQILPGMPPRGRTRGHAQAQRNGQILVDTSAIIDGRIADISQAGFVRGTLVIPRFILDELRHIADSSDAMRRNRGRRGLEVLHKLRTETQIGMQVLDVEMRDGTEVDGKLVKLAKTLHAPIVTTDFNLNRVAELQGVQVLNVNELANALRPVVLPGEEMDVRVIQEGREAGQGVGFLDDGTMVVIEGGRRYINQHLTVVVTRVLQTAAGRIIFTQTRAT